MTTPNRGGRGRKAAQKAVSVTITLSPNLLAQLDAHATARGLSRSAAIAAALTTGKTNMGSSLGQVKRIADSLETFALELENVFYALDPKGTQTNHMAHQIGDIHLQLSGWLEGSTTDGYTPVDMEALRGQVAEARAHFEMFRKLPEVEEYHESTEGELLVLADHFTRIQEMLGGVVREEPSDFLAPGH